MNQLIIENIDPMIVEKLKIRAQRQGRTLDAELKAILSSAAEVVEVTSPWENIDKARAKYTGKTFSDSAELLREDRQR
jgi:antitoxin FitA